MRQPTLTTARLTLTPAAPFHLEALWAIWREPDVRRYLFDDAPVGRERASEVLDSCLGVSDRGLGLWVVEPREVAELPEIQEIMGCVGLLPTLSADHAPALAGSIEALASLSPRFWHRGYAVESLRALVDYAFRDLGLRHLAGVTDLPNVASHRMLTRLGFAVIDECPGPCHRLRIYRLETGGTMTDRSAFRRAIESHDLEQLLSVFREDAVLHSPITFQPFEGKAAIRRLLAIIFEVFQDFHYIDELDSADGMTKILVFRTKVRNRDAEGIDMVRFDAAGLVCDLTVMVRPRSSMETLLAEVQPRLMAALQADAT